MNELLKDYNNNQLKIFLLDEQYSALLVNENNELLIKLMDKVDRDTYLKLDKSFRIVNGEIGGRDITFFDLISNSRTFDSMTGLFSMTFRVDMFIDGMRYTSNKNRKVKSINFEFYNLENFSASCFYTFDKKLNPIFNQKYMEYDFNDYKIKIFLGRVAIPGDSIYTCEKTIGFTIEYNHKQLLQNVVQDIWNLKCFMGIISKRMIGIKRITINDNNILFMNFTYFEDKNYKNDFFQHDYENFVLTLEDIENDFKSIYERFLIVFKNVTPVFDIYLNMIEKEMSSMNRFLNCTQIIEYLSKEYDAFNAMQIWINNGSCGKHITLADRIESMINNVNYIWRFRKKRIHELSLKIAGGRNYFNHHTQPSKKLNNDELFRFSYFLEDLILGYLYEKFGISQKIIKNKLCHNLYYDIKHIK